ncbi:hypothetical protein Vafri_11264 [Volvox africanus]|nr:hypothetical protein Vafri_11264 [Volvox africanus]
MTSFCTTASCPGPTPMTRRCCGRIWNPPWSGITRGLARPSAPFRNGPPLAPAAAPQLPPEEAQELYLAALEEGRREQAAEMRQMRQHQQRGDSGADSLGEQVEQVEQMEQQAEDLSPEIARQLAQIKVVAGGQVTAAVMQAFTAVSGGDLAAAERAVVFRCAEVLWSMAPPSHGPVVVVSGAAEAPSATTRPSVTDGAADRDVRGDMQLNEAYRNRLKVADNDDDKEEEGEEVELVTSSTTTGVVGGGSGGSGGGLLLELAMLVADDDPQILMAPGTEAAAAEGEMKPESGGLARYWADQLRGYYQALLPRFVELIPEGAALTEALTEALAGASSTSAPGSHAATVTTTAATASASIKGKCVIPATADRTPDGAGIKSRYGLPPPSKAAAAPAQDAAATAFSGDRGKAEEAVPVGKLVRALLHWGTGAEGAAEVALRLTGPQRLVTAFRCYKQMVLWDVLLGSAGIEAKDLADFLRGGGDGDCDGDHGGAL